MKCDTGLQRYLNQHELGICSLLAGACLITFMALLPMLVDPSIVTFVLNLQPASCLTLYSAELRGNNCTWTSCQQGCTVDFYKCWQINVSYSLHRGRGSDWPPPPPTTAAVAARLFPNVVGCGYPPAVNCSEFYREYATPIGQTFDCFVSLQDPTVAVIHVDVDEAAANFCLGFVPLVVFVAIVAYVSWRYRCKRRRRLAKAATADQVPAQVVQEKQRIEENKRLLERRKQSWINSFRLDRVASSSRSLSNSSLSGPQIDNYCDRAQAGAAGAAGAGAGAGAEAADDPSVRNFMYFTTRAKLSSRRPSNSAPAPHHTPPAAITSVSASVVAAPMPRLVVN